MLQALAKGVFWTVAGVLALLFLSLVSTSGCQRLNKFGKHWESGFEGLDRTISVYTDDGRLFARWNAKTYIETDPPVVAFLDSAGKEVKIHGGIVIVNEH